MADIKNFTKREALCFFAFIVILIMILYGMTVHEPSVPSYNTNFYDKLSDGNIFSYRLHPENIEKDMGEKRDIPTTIPSDESVGTIAIGQDQKSNTVKMKEKIEEKMMYFYLQMA